MVLPCGQLTTAATEKSDQNDLNAACLIVGSVALATIGLCVLAMGLAGWGSYQTWWNAGCFSYLGFGGSISLIVVGSAITAGGVLVPFSIVFPITQDLVEERPSSQKNEFLTIENSTYHPEYFEPLPLGTAGYQISDPPQYNAALRPDMSSVLQSARESGEKNEERRLLIEDAITQLIDTDTGDNAYRRYSQTILFHQYQYEFSEPMKNLESNQDQTIAKGEGWGMASLTNDRGIGKPNEDRSCFSKFVLNDGTQVTLSGVFDGHADMGIFAQGAKTFLRDAIEKRLNQLEVEQRSKEQIQEMLTQICLECDRLPQLHEALQEEALLGGTTATCALEMGGSLYVFNVGDSRAILLQKREEGLSCFQLTEDASPANMRFRKEVLDAGFSVGGNRVEGYVREHPAQLAVARDLGIPFLSPIPDVICLPIGEQKAVNYQRGDYLILATDGLWDNCYNGQAKDLIARLDQEGASLAQMAKELAYRARLAGSQDDITVLVLKL